VGAFALTGTTGLMVASAISSIHAKDAAIITTKVRREFCAQDGFGISEAPFSGIPTCNLRNIDLLL
jgi:hypothetical protein